MGKTIIDYITKTVKVDGKALHEIISLSVSIALKSSESFFKLYEMVTKSNDKKLKKEAQKIFGKTVVEIAVALHKIQEYKDKLYIQ